MPNVKKLNHEIVFAIRSQYDNSNHKQLAEKFGLSMQCIFAVAYYRIYANYEPARETVTYHIPARDCQLGGKKVTSDFSHPWYTKTQK